MSHGLTAHILASLLHSPAGQSGRPSSGVVHEDDQYKWDFCTPAGLSVEHSDDGVIEEVPDSGFNPGSRSFNATNNSTSHGHNSTRGYNDGFNPGNSSFGNGGGGFNPGVSQPRTPSSMVGWV